MGNETKKKLFVVEKYFPLNIPLIKIISLNCDKIINTA